MLRGGGKHSLLTLVNVNAWVLVLLQYCLWFYLVSLGQRFYGAVASNVLLIVGVAVSSFVMYFCFDAEGWCYERWGLAWGVLLFMFMPQVKRFVRPKPMRILMFCLLCMILGVAYLKFKPVYFYGEFALKIILGVFIITLLFMMSSQMKFGNKVINFLGDISYEVYLSHGFIMSCLVNVFPGLPSGWFILTTVMLTIVFSAVIHYIGKPIVRFCRA